MNRHTQRESGLTLIEVIVAIALLGLAGLAVNVVEICRLVRDAV